MSSISQKTATDFVQFISFKETKSATMNIFQKKIFSF